MLQVPTADNVVDVAGIARLSISSEINAKFDIDRYDFTLNGSETPLIQLA
jgi:hypothetical protein